jgi:hypothetical protein
VDIELILQAAIGGGNHKGLAFADKAQVADQSFIQNVVDLLGVVAGPLGDALDLGAGGRGVGHGFGEWMGIYSAIRSAKIA